MTKMTKGFHLAAGEEVAVQILPGGKLKQVPRRPAPKLPKKLEDELWEVLKDLRRGLAYLKREDIAVAMRCTLATTTRHYTQYHPKEPKHLLEVEKFVGSNLCGVFDAAEKLKKLLGDNDV